MKPRGNKPYLDHLSRSARYEIEQCIKAAVRKKQLEVDETDKPTEAQSDDNRKVPPERTYSPRREFPHHQFFRPNVGTYEYPYRPTAEEIARMRELSEPGAAMGRTRSNSF